MNYAKFRRTPFLAEHLWWLLLILLTLLTNNTGAIDVKMDGSVLEEKSPFKILGLTFFSILDWGPYIISITKTASKTIGASIRSMKFLPADVALHLYKPTIRPCMEYFCHVWAGALNCYLQMLDKLLKLIYRAIAPSLPASVMNLWLIAEM